MDKQAIFDMKVSDLLGRECVFINWRTGRKNTGVIIGIGEYQTETINLRGITLKVPWEDVDLAKGKEEKGHGT